MRALLLTLALVTTTTASAQWDIQTPVTTADLRGIANVDGSVAWASGSNGTVLRTEDAGYLWQRCITPPGAEHLDFRGIQAFDANTAIVMSSGKGDLSRLYRTIDGCQTWQLIYSNPDIEGFFDAIRGSRSPNKTSANVMIVGDPVIRRFTLFYLEISLTSNEAPKLIQFPNTEFPNPHLERQLPDPANEDVIKTFALTESDRQPNHVLSKHPYIPLAYKSPVPQEDEALFAASNSSLSFDSNAGFQPDIAFVTGGPRGARFLRYRAYSCCGKGCESWIVADLPLARSASSGAFSIATTSRDYWHGVIVGGDYNHPDATDGTAAFTKDDGQSWSPSLSRPHGYRSAVAYDPTTKPGSP